MARLFIGSVLVAIVWTLLQFHSSSPTDPIDTVILIGMGIVYTVAGFVMLFFRRSWSTRAVGLFLTVAGAAVLYEGVGWGRQLEHAPPEWLTDLARSCFVVGGVFLLWGLIWWVDIRVRDTGTREWDQDGR